MRDFKKAQRSHYGNIIKPQRFYAKSHERTKILFSRGIFVHLWKATLKRRRLAWNLFRRRKNSIILLWLTPGDFACKRKELISRWIWVRQVLSAEHGKTSNLLNLRSCMLTFTKTNFSTLVIVGCCNFMVSHPLFIFDATFCL